MTVALGIFAGCLLLGLGLFAFKNPTICRMALRNVLRRRVEALLIVAGCALGTTIIIGSLLFGDSIEGSLFRKAYERLGPVDVIVSTRSPQINEAIQTIMKYDPVANSDGTLGAVATEATLATPNATNDRKVIPAARLLEVDFKEAMDFGGDSAATGVTGATPKLGEIVLGKDIAKALGVNVGQEIEVYAYGNKRRLEVVRLLQRRGIAGYSGEFEAIPLNAFVAPGTIAGMAFYPDFPENARPPEYLLFFSGRGGVLSGAEETGALLAQIRARLGIFSGYDVEPVKKDLLRGAAEDGAEFAELFLSLGTFTILAGAALLINMLVMLSEQRRRELGILRAMGMSRRDLVLLLVFEGALYAFAASLLGAAAGIGAARLIVLLARGIFSSARQDGLVVQFALNLASLLTGFVAGFALSLLVVAVAGVWIGRMTVVEAIKDSARPKTRRLSPLMLSVAGVGAVIFCALAVFSVVSSEDIGSLVFPILAFLCLCTVAAGSSTGLTPKTTTLRKAIVSLSAIVSMLWVVLAFPLLDLSADNTILFVAQGLVLTLGLVVLAIQYQPLLGTLLSRLGGATLVLRLALAYPSFRRFRTATTLVAYSLIVFTLVFSSILSNTFSNQAEQLADDEGGAYDLLVSTTSADPVATKQLATVAGVEDTAALNWTVADFRVGKSGRFKKWTVSGFDHKFVQEGPMALEDFDKSKYPSKEAVWRATLKDPSLMIADVAFLESGGGPPENNVAVGDRVEIKSPVTGETTERTVVAISAAGAAFSGVMLSKESLDQFVEEPVANRHYITVSEGRAPAVVAERLQQKFLTNGLEARTFGNIVRKALNKQQSFFDLIEGYLAFGLLVGIASLGIIMVRAVRERRRQIGLLRALGFSPSAVRATFLFESSLIAVEGVIIGASLALATSYQLIVGSTTFGDAGASFAVPWLQLTGLIATVSIVSLLIAVPSAYRALAISSPVWLRPVEEGGA